MAVVVVATLALFIFRALLMSTGTGTAQAQPMPWQLCNISSGNYTENSTYKANIEYLATSLPQYASSSPNLFASGSSGTVPDIIYAIALCRGDTNASSCATCVAAAIQEAGKLCPLVKSVTMYDDPCILRFSQQGFPITPPYDRGGIMIAWNYNNLSAAVAPSFQAATARLVNATVEYAAADPIRRFGTGEAAFDDVAYPKIYSLAQCTPDMTADECRSCLSDIIGRFAPKYFAGKRGGRVLGVRCNYRFETSPFFYGRPLLQLQLQPPDGPSPAPASQAAGEGITDNRSKVVAIAVPTIAAVLFAFVACWCCLWRRRPAAKALQPKSTSPDDIESIGSLLLDLSTLRVATGDFSEHKRLGEGGFGVVYKGDLPDGQEIAVKRLAQTSRQGIEELKTELLLVAKLNHNNLVRLIGVCLEENEKILAYEYMPNKSLDTILFDAAKAKELDWVQRFKIISGIARGLQYLHEDSQLKIVHRDLKASNVLLNSSYNPKISDFGLAKTFGRDQSHVVTHRIAGTYGYMSPEYAMRGQCSMKSDVFSFGVLVLEIVTGRRNFVSYDSEQDVDLINLIWEHWTRDKAIDLIDASLNGSYPVDNVLKCIHIGLLCVQQKPTDRPLMSAVNYMLNSNTACLHPLSRPTIWFRETDELNPKASISWGTKSSLNEVSITEIESR